MTDATVWLEDDSIVKETMTGPVITFEGEMTEATISFDNNDALIFPDWRDISTAPTNGTIFLGWLPNGDPGEPAICLWSGSDWLSNGQVVEPTYWMPLPPQPNWSVTDVVFDLDTLTIIIT